jgi:hypothetical protein
MANHKYVLFIGFILMPLCQLDHFEKRHAVALAEGDDSAAVYPPNMQLCYESFLRHGAKVENLLPLFAELDLAPWMSGLICSQNNDCITFHNLISSSNVKESLASIKAEMVARGFSVDNSGCPPGCGCDNPWSFMPTSK